MAEFEWHSGWCNGTHLKMDTACLHMMSQSPQNIALFIQSEECYMCKLVKKAVIPPKGKVSLEMWTPFPFKMYFKSNRQQWCNTTYKFEEYGHYGWNISNGSCDSIEVLERPNNTYYRLGPDNAILGAFIIIFLYALLWNLVRCCLDYERRAPARERVVPSLEKQSELGSLGLAQDPKLMKSEMPPGVQRQRTRVVSLDTFRGLTIAIMIFIHHGGGGYMIFNRHCNWNGLHVADLLFPWFMWIMGASLVFWLRSQLRSSQSRQRIFLRVLQRSTILIALGLSINSRGSRKADVFKMRLNGLLQRTGISYLIVGTIETMFVKPQGSVKIRRLLSVQDVLDSWLQWLLVIIVTTVHTALTFLMPVPNCPTGYLGPGGLHYSLTEGDKFANCTGGAAAYIDKLVFGEERLPHSTNIYQTSQAFDDYGLLGTLSSVLTVYLGVQAGRVMLYYRCMFPRVARWIIWAAITGIPAGVLCNFSKEEGWIPVNKHLWSLSFVLALASMAFLILSFLYLVIDDRHWWSGTPFHYAGMNPLILFVGHELTSRMFPWSWRNYFNSHTEHLIMNLWGTILWLITAYVLFRKNLFLSV